MSARNRDKSKPLLPITEPVEGSKPSIIHKGKQKMPVDSSMDPGPSDLPVIPEPPSNVLVKYPVRMVIKFSDTTLPDKELVIQDLSEYTVTSLRQEIRRDAGPKLAQRRLRLISGGKVLNDQTDLLHEFLGNRHSSGIPKVFIHCSIGDVLSASELAKESMLDAMKPTRSTLPELRGFDRLRNAGFSEEDVNQLRQQFSSLYETQERENITQLEEQWIDTGATDVAASLIGGDYMDDLVGILIGMFLGVMAIFFMKESSLFSKRQQKAIAVGVAVNFSFALLRIFY